jgi:hypothetical protein
MNVPVRTGLATACRRYFEDFFLLILFMLFMAGGMAYGQEQIEKEKIHYLINSVEKMEEAVFIRNGSEHNGVEAANHLCMKLERAGDQVQTADDFIKLCASKSYLTGKPYMIRFNNRKTMKAEEYFREKLLSFKPGVK